MTEELLAKAKIAQANIQSIENALNAIKRIKIVDIGGRTYSPKLRFSNILKKKDGKEVREATVYLFDGVSIYGTELIVDERLLDCLKEHYSERLSEAKAVLDAM